MALYLRLAKYAYTWNQNIPWKTKNERWANIGRVEGSFWDGLDCFFPIRTAHRDEGRSQNGQGVESDVDAEDESQGREEMDAFVDEEGSEGQAENGNDERLDEPGEDEVTAARMNREWLAIGVVTAHTFLFCHLLGRRTSCDDQQRAVDDVETESQHGRHRDGPVDEEALPDPEHREEEATDGAEHREESDECDAG